MADAVARFENEGRDSDAPNGRVSAHEIFRTSERTEGAEAEKERLPTAQNQQMDRMLQAKRTCRLFYGRIGRAELPNRPGRLVDHA